MPPKGKNDGPSPDEEERLKKIEAEQAEMVRQSEEAYVRYIAESGIASQLSRILVGLYESGERPDNVVDWAERFLGTESGVNYVELKGKKQLLLKRNDELKAMLRNIGDEVEVLQAAKLAALAAQEEDE
mmetsp:Transcript_14205/g.23297  ORF Transcript_14205/g.23297 Transcript_14205/m.23297 type:complete len:129 (-) Transcript_14205:167-553(-)|eukprot:CAMPEP_0169138100 /NCGR_PEP_ID=MMETSP1015-20121227/41995_1 /TAXON_ID=342587 /ORGANISM="Karlodinium micrum, Strain CCMP2283" /LENGTH=128 /DNA_ID=CAMNT_0009203195 /DNA_START=44 /DNA_END=430 /DNA_ORIENTATION=+